MPQLCSFPLRETNRELKHETQIPAEAPDFYPLLTVLTRRAAPAPIHCLFALSFCWFWWREWRERENKAWDCKERELGEDTAMWKPLRQMSKYSALLRTERYSIYITQLPQDSLNQKGPEIKTRFPQTPLSFLFSKMQCFLGWWIQDGFKTTPHFSV